MGGNGNSSDPMAVLMASGTVRGVCVLKHGEVIFEKFPYSAARLVKVCRVVEGLTKEFSNQGRSVDQMAFGYDGGNLIAVTVKGYRLVAMHLMNDEIDFLAKAARAHLEDYIALDGESSGEREEMDRTVPITPKTREEKEAASREWVEETSRVEILTAAPVAVVDEDEGGLNPDNMSVEDLVGYYASKDDEE